MSRRCLGAAAAIVAAVVPLADAASGVVTEGHASPAAPSDGLAILPGGVRSGNTITYEGGEVVLTLPASAAASTPCPDGWSCIYHDANWLGRMLQFRTPCTWQNLGDYGFNDQTSSWSNHRSYITTLSWDAGGGGAHYHMGAWTHAAHMGDWNDESSAIHVGSSSC